MQATLVAVVMTATMVASVSALAQEADNVGHGRQIAQTIDQRVSPPPFPVIAATPGLTSIALTAALLMSHRLMPNIIMKPEDRRDVIAYILSLK